MMKNEINETNEKKLIFLEGTLDRATKIVC